MKNPRLPFQSKLSTPCLQPVSIPKTMESMLSHFKFEPELQFGQANLCCTWKAKHMPPQMMTGRMKRYDSKHHRGKVIQIEIFTDFFSLRGGTLKLGGVEQTALETRNLICIHCRFVYFFCHDSARSLLCERWVSFDSNDEKQFWNDLLRNFEWEKKMKICLIFSNWGNLCWKSSKWVIRHILWILPNLSTGWNGKLALHLGSTSSSVYQIFMKMCHDRLVWCDFSTFQPKRH